MASRMMMVAVLIAVLAVGGRAQQQNAALANLKTTAESSDYKSTSTHADVVKFMQAIDAASPIIYYTTYGKTAQGRDMPLAIVGTGLKDFSPASVLATGKLRVHIQANIHAGEVEGKEAMQVLLRELAMGQHADWLKSMVYDQALVTDELIEERWQLATDPVTLAAARRMYGKAAFAAMNSAMAASDRPFPWAVMHKLAAPTLLTWGRDDRVSPPDMALIPMRTIPNAELHIFPNSGHWAMIEAKAAFESTVLGFLSRT